MDQIKVGRFISELRRERGLTQEQLGELVGVTNKTVSRWETGTYMPPIEALEALSKEFGITINEIIAGEHLSGDGFRAKAEENIVNAWQDSSFMLFERQKYFKRLWLKNHAFLRSLHIAACIILILLGKRFENYWLMGLGGGMVFVGQIIVYNRMMSYAERKAFEKPDREESEKK